MIRFDKYIVLNLFSVRTNLTSISPLKIPFLSHDASFQVCLCRTMLFYLDAVALLRALSQSLLFIPHSVDAVHNFTPPEVSRYVIQAIW